MSLGLADMLTGVVSGFDLFSILSRVCLLSRAGAGGAGLLTASPDHDPAKAELNCLDRSSMPILDWPSRLVQQLGDGQASTLTPLALLTDWWEPLQTVRLSVASTCLNVEEWTVKTGHSRLRWLGLSKPLEWPAARG